jgi:hypothetical protein
MGEENEPKTDEELKVIASDLLDGKIYCDRHCRSAEDTVQVFMILGLMGTEAVEQMQKDEIDFVYEYLDQAGPRSCNGKPMFMSCRMLSKTETAKMFEFYEAFRAAKEQVMNS